MKLTFLAIPIACLGLAGCMETGPYGGPAPAVAPAPVARAHVQRGTIVSVRQVVVGSSTSDQQAAGALIGAAAGAIIGNQFGEGGGRTAATIAGAGAGAYAGSQIAKSNATTRYSYAWTVRLRDGRRVTIVQNSGNLHVGDHVRVVWQSNNRAYIQRL